MYQLWINIWTGRDWAVEKYHTMPYDSLKEAEQVVAYITHHDNELGERLTIRERRSNND